jgi:hypothetical protein
MPGCGLQVNAPCMTAGQRTVHDCSLRGHTWCRFPKRATCSDTHDRISVGSATALTQSGLSCTCSLYASPPPSQARCLPPAWRNIAVFSDCTSSRHRERQNGASSPSAGWSSPVHNSLPPGAGGFPGRGAALPAPPGRQWRRPGGGVPAGAGGGSTRGRAGPCGGLPGGAGAAARARRCVRGAAEEAVVLRFAHKSSLPVRKGPQTVGNYQDKKLPAVNNNKDKKLLSLWGGQGLELAYARATGQ